MDMCKCDSAMSRIATRATNKRHCNVIVIYKHWNVYHNAKFVVQTLICVRVIALCQVPQQTMRLDLVAVFMLQTLMYTCNFDVGDSNKHFEQSWLPIDCTDIDMFGGIDM